VVSSILDFGSVTALYIYSSQQTYRRQDQHMAVAADFITNVRPWRLP